MTIIDFLLKWKGKVEQFETTDMGSIEYRSACLDLIEEMLRDAEESGLTQVSRTEVILNE